MTIFTSFAQRQDWLPDYLLDLRLILHDASADYFQDAELVSYINEARAHVCVDTGCLRNKLTITLPGGIESFPIGGVYEIINVATPAGTPPYTLVSGGGATATASLTVPITVSVTGGGSYYQPPLITFDSGEEIVSISAAATAVLASIPANAPVAVGSVFVNYDNGGFNNHFVTPSVRISSVGVPAQVEDDGTGHLKLTSFGAGQSTGVVIQDAAGVVTSVPASSVNMLDARIASIDQMTVLWGSQRVPLRNYAYSDFNVQVRGIVGFQSVPIAFSMIGSTLYIGPIPNQSYNYELDCIMYPRPLLDYAEMGEIMDRSSIMAVKYYAAYRAKVSINEEEAAAAFLQLYAREIDWSANRFTTRLSQLWPYNENLE